MDKLSIENKEQALFNEWPRHDDPLFCWDGLHCTGTPSKETGTWLMKPDHKEERLWFDSPIRCLFLTKDHNLQGEEDSVDIREETGLIKETNTVYYKFYARYLQLLYGLMHIDTTTFEYPPFEVAQQVDTYLNYFYQAPVVRINTKKIAGYSSCPANVLASYLNSDGEYIKRQIALYDANVIVACQGVDWNINGDHSDIFFILDLLYQQFPDMKKWRNDIDCIYYSEKTKTIFLREWHPSYSVSYSDYYQGTRFVAEFLKEHPEYLRK